MTTLLDNTHYPRKDFAGLYHLRWQIEVENLSGESILSVQQDYHALGGGKRLQSMFLQPLFNEYG